MESITTEVNAVVGNWKEIASGIGIPRSEQLLMESAFSKMQE